MNLYDIANHIRLILDNVDADGEMAPDVESDLNNLSDDLTIKADQIARYQRQCVANAEGYKAESDRLALLAKSESNKAERLKKYLKDTFDALHITKLDTELFKFGVQKNSVPTTTYADGFDPAKLPEHFQRVTIAPNTSAIVAAWKDHAPLPAGVTIEVGSHLRIR